MSTRFDAIIAGGGVAGAAAASLLAQDGRQVALVERRRPVAVPADADFDPRVVAISPGSRNVLQAAGGWHGLAPQRIAPFARMAVHADGGSIEFAAGEHGLDWLGWIVEVPALQYSLWQALEKTGKVEIKTPSAVAGFEPRRDSITVRLDSGERLRTELLIAADGARSRLRRQAGIDARIWHYNQHALVTHVTTELPNEGLAWQRFTEYGPLALLPLPDGRSSIVWSVPSREAARLRQMDDPEFLVQLNDCQDSPFGQVTATSRRYILPLIRRGSQRLVEGRLVLLGDAARTVHPLAGQGLNLGLMDAAVLTEVLAGSDEAGIESALARYERWRLGAGSMIAGGIHSINELTAGNPLGRQLAGLGFGIAGSLWPLRELFVQRACGIDSDSPKLARQPG